MEMLGIEALKRLPHHSSSSVQDIESRLKELSNEAESRTANIVRIVNMEEFVSKALVDLAHDDLAVVRQITAALKELLEHFQQTIAKGSFEVALDRSSESLRKAEKSFNKIVAFVAR